MKKTMDVNSAKKDSRIQSVFDVISASLFFILVGLGLIFLARFFYDYF